MCKITLPSHQSFCFSLTQSPTKRLMAWSLWKVTLCLSDQPDPIRLVLNSKKKKILWTLLFERLCNVFTALRLPSALLVAILVCMWECSGWRNKKAYLLPRWSGSQPCKRTLIVGQEVERVIYWLEVGASIPTCLLTTCQSLFGQDTKYTS